MVSLSPPGGCLFCVVSFLQAWCTAVQKKADHLDTFRTLCLFVVSEETKKKLTAEFVAITKDTKERCSSMLELSNYDLPDAMKLWAGDQGMQFMFTNLDFSHSTSLSQKCQCFCWPFPILFILDTQVPSSSKMTMKQALWTQWKQMQGGGRVAACRQMVKLEDWDMP